MIIPRTGRRFRHYGSLEAKEESIFPWGIPILFPLVFPILIPGIFILIVGLAPNREQHIKVNGQDVTCPTEK